MAEVLKVFHFAKQHCVTEMQIWRSGIEASFNSQGTAKLFPAESAARGDPLRELLRQAPSSGRQLFVNGHYFIKARRPIRA
jgi:hypothetical protein